MKKQKKQKRPSPTAKGQLPTTRKKRRFFLFSNIGLGEEKDYFMENLGMLLSSGMNIISALDAVGQGMRSAKMIGLVEELKKNVSAGISFSEALEEMRLFSPHIISLARIGERAGRLSDNLKVIVLNQQKERIFRSKVRSAMMYPALVLSLTLIVGVGIAWFILPNLSSVFSQLKIELPLITKILIGAGNILKKYGTVIIPIFFLFLSFFIYIVFICPKTKHIGQTIMLNIPLIKRLVQETELARAGFILGTLTDSGLSVVDALDSLAQATTFNVYKKLYGYLKESIEKGSSFNKSFAEYRGINKLIPYPIQQMIIASEQSAKLSDTFTKIGEIFENKTEITTKNLAVLIEPILLVIIWVGVISVALAVILPIYSLIGGINK